MAALKALGKRTYRNGALVEFRDVDYNILTFKEQIMADLGMYVLVQIMSTGNDHSLLPPLPPCHSRWYLLVSKFAAIIIFAAIMIFPSDIAGTDIMIGPHGAGLMHNIFMRDRYVRTVHLLYIISYTRTSPVISSPSTKNNFLCIRI